MVVCLRQSVFVPPLLCVLAEELGCFDEAGLRVETLTVTSSARQRDQLCGGEADVGVTAIDNLVVWNARGADLRLVAQIESTTALRLVARGSCSSVAELRGAKLGVDAVDNGFSVVLRHLLGTHGLGPGDYTLLPVGGVRERWDALGDGSIDATLLGPPLDEYARAEGFTVLVKGEDVLPDYPGQGVVVPAALADDPALVRYIGALDRALRLLRRTSDDEVVRTLVRSGWGDAAAAACLRTRPVSLVPSRAGLERLLTLRGELGMMPEPPVTADDLCAPGLLGEVTGT
ncbi:ABC transporter substrate-binding protein [Streptomyces scabiei]|uniref:ABC transporter substrate-binding protein n=1 Tax=Streptomyces scabiei TaxID=1930 RepID=UPI00068D566C|nr:ABC transporter substrate-binding protein [Streptomyces scabiei]